MNESILVVGGGIAGRAVALALAQHDLPCTVVDQPRPDAGLGMGLNLPGNAVRALRQLGVADQVVAHGVPVRRREYRSDRGRLLFAVDDEAFWRGVGAPVCVRHGHLSKALEPPASHTRLHRARVAGARTTPEGRVAVQLANDQHERHYDFVIGADGVHSTVRCAIAETGVRPSAMTLDSWRFIADDPGVRCWTAWSGRIATLLLIPVEEGRVYGYAASSRGALVGPDPRWLATAFAHFPTPVSQVIEGVLSGDGPLHHAPVDEVRLRSWHRGGLVLVGDAAHATGPVWAQGAAMALEDALVLSELLTVGLRATDVGARFEQLRRSRVEGVQAATDRMSALARLPGWLRDRSAPLVGPRTYRRAYGPLRLPASTG